MAFISPSSVLEMENDEEGDDEDGSLLEMEIFPSTWSNSKSEASKRVAVALTMVSIPFLSRYFVRRLVWILLLPPPRDDERKVLEAIKILFDSVDEIEIFNKKAIYLYMREITGLNTKQIVNNLNRIRQRYRTFKTEWEKGSI